jgi:hypothetical protein
LIAISHAEAALTNTLLFAPAMALRAEVDSEESSASHHSKA